MHSKKPLFVALAMCLSFTAILSFMLALSTPDPRPKRKRTAARQSVVKPTPQKSRLLAAQERRKAKHSEKTPASSPTKQAALPQTPPAAPAAATAPVAKMDQAAVQEIQKLKRDLLQRVSSQEKNLNDLMTQLARQLVDMPATNAAAQIKALDDEAATRVLAHISTRQRDPILKQLAPKRAKRLNRSLAASAAN